MSIDRSEYDAISRKAEAVLGHEKIDSMSRPQINLLNRAVNGGHKLYQMAA